MRALFDLQGREVALGRCLGRGGEGAVYAVPRSPEMAAKIYAHRPGEARVDKIGAMIAIGAGSPLDELAWPSGLLLESRGGPVIGFLMPRVEGHVPLHALYSPRTRGASFPGTRWDFLVRAARNLAAAFETAHASGLVVGDVNEGNAVVSPRGEVRLIDCDSFQVPFEGRTFPCEVGVPLFTPPELQGRGFEGVVRTTDHDGFGLAVLLFQLLFMGRHPYAGRHPTREVAVDSAIREGLFAFGWEAARQGWQPPPFTLRLADMPSDVARLFDRAFSREAAGGAPRPSAGRWVTALESLEAGLATCRADPQHRHARGDGECPWCRIEASGGPRFFLPGSRTGLPRDLATAWRAILAVAPPGPPVLPPPPDPAAFQGRPPLPGVTRDRWLRRTAAVALVFAAGAAVVLEGGVGTGLALALLMGLAGLRGLGREEMDRRAREGAVTACERELGLLEGRFRAEAGDQPFTRKLAELRRAREGLESAEQVHESERQEAIERVRQARLAQHLKRQALAGADIPELGAEELAHLHSQGMFTAADVEPEAFSRRPEMHVLSVDVAPGLAAELLAWRARVEARFEFDPERALRAQDLLELEERVRVRREGWERALRDGAGELRRLRRDILERRRRRLPALCALQRTLAQRRADLQGLS